MFFLEVNAVLWVWPSVGRQHTEVTAMFRVRGVIETVLLNWLLFHFMIVQLLFFYRTIIHAMPSIFT